MRVENGLYSKHSGKIQHPDRRWYKQLTARCAEAINSVEDSDGMKLTTKAMIRFGLSLDIDVRCKVEQLHTELQHIVTKHNLNFNGIEPIRMEDSNH